MLDRGIRHLPVLSATGRVLGVVEDADLVAGGHAHARSSSAPPIARATTREVARGGGGALAAGDRSSCTPRACRRARWRRSARWSWTRSDRRLFELAVAEGEAPPVPFAWFALGSVARREAVPSSDVDSALVWYADDGDPGPALRALAGRVVDGLAACGFAPDPNGAVASRPLFARSAAAWRAAARSWLEDPTQDEGARCSSRWSIDGRPVWGIHTGLSVPDAFADARRHPQLLRLLARFALSLPAADRLPARLRGRALRRAPRPARPQARGHRPDRRPRPLGGHGGRRDERSTRARLRAAADAGTLAADDAATLDGGASS